MSRRKYRVVAIEDPLALAGHLVAWEELAAAAIEPNVFYEQWMLIPALQAFAQGETLRIVLVYAEEPGRQPMLQGVFPLELMTRYKGLPIRYVRLWQHRHCYLGTPLVRGDGASECLRAFLDWLADAGIGSMMEWRLISGDGPFYEVLSEALQATGRRSFLAHRYERAVLRAPHQGDPILGANPSAKSLKELKRQERRLAELGELRYQELSARERPAADAAQPWLEEFLALEAAGWKGAQGSALASNEANRSFFLRVATAAARRGRLMMLGLHAGSQPLALKCNFLAGDGAFAFKIAYDENYAKFSPGVLLELEHIRRVRARPQIRWMDSCASAEHPMIDRLWPGRRAIVNLVSATGAAAGDVAVASLPVLRWAYRNLRRTSAAMERA